MKKLVGSLIDYFIERTGLVTAITLALTLVGGVALWGMKRDLHPPFQFNYLQISFSHPAASAEELERLVTYPLEEAVRDIPQLETMNSHTKAGGGNITLKFPMSVKDLTAKIEEIRGRMQSVERLLPPDLRNLEVSRLGDNEVFVANLGVSGIDPHNWVHHQFIDRVRNQLRAIQGVVNVESSLRPYHLFIRFDHERLAAHGVTVAQIRSAVRAELQGNAIGRNSISGKDWLLEFSPTAVSPAKVAALPLFRNRQGYGVKIGDVAKVDFDLETNGRYQFLLDGAKAVELTVLKGPERDVMATFKDVEAVLAGLQLPSGVTLKVLYDGPYFIQQQIGVLTSNGFGGLLLVLLMLALAMGWRTSLMTALGLPVSYFGTFLVLRSMGISIDLISIIAMILVVGNLVDDAVIFAERYSQLLSDGLEPKTAASAAARELIVPVTGTIATIICAFIPIIAIDSELSVIFFAIPVVVTVALALSWFETFFILPNHLQHFVKKPAGDRATLFFHGLARGYRRALRHTLRWRYVYGLASVALLAGSLYIAKKMPQDFSLSINAPQVEVYVTFKDELTFAQVEKILAPLHHQLMALPKEEFDFIETNLGWLRRAGKTYRGPKYATVRVVLNKHEVDVRALRERVEKKVAAILLTYKPVEISEIVAVANERGDDNRRKGLASVQLRGRDGESFRQAQQEAIKVFAGQKNIGENVPPDDLGPLTFQFAADTEALRGFRVPREELGFQIQAQTGTVEIAEMRDSGRWMRVLLEPQRLREPDLKQLSRLTVQSPEHGEIFPLQRLGSWQAAGYSQGVEHKNGARVLTLDFRFDEKKTNEQEIKTQLQELLPPLAQKYPGVEIKVIDANEQDKKGREWTLKVVAAAALLIYLILALTLRSWTQPLIVGLPIPFALIGVIWALKLHGLSLGLMAMIGLIGTMGVAVNDSIVMVHHINQLCKAAGRRTAELIIEGAASRLRAIFLTASCTLVGVFPTAYGWGGESGFTQPLAFSMGWGLSASLLLTLFIIPAMLLVFEDMHGLTSKLMNRLTNKLANRVKVVNKSAPPFAEKFQNDHRANQYRTELDG